MRLNSRLAMAVMVLCWASGPAVVMAQDVSTCPAVGKPAKVSLPNASFVDARPDGMPERWIAKEHRVTGHYEFALDGDQPYSPPRSARIRQVKPEDFGLLDQTLKVADCWQGKKARLSAYLRTDRADGVGAGLMMQSIGPDGGIQTWNHMNDNKVRGTQPWKRYQIDIPIPANAYSLKVGVMLEEQGTLWADDVSLEIVD